MVLNSGEETWRITKETIEFLPTSNHEEIDKRLILDARMDNVVVRVVPKDPGVIFFLIYPFGQNEFFLPS